jgi:hypothetical protein
MACITTQNYTLPCRNNSGGVNVVYIADFADKGTPTLSAASGTVTAWTDAAGDFYTYQTRPEVANGSFNATMTDANGTTVYAHSVSFTLEQLSGNRNVENDILAKGRFLIMFKDNNGKYFVLGYTNGMRCSAMENGTGTANADLNGTKFTFTSNEPFPAYEVDSTIVAAMLAA